MDLEARLASALAARDGRGIKRSLSPERHPQLDHPNLVDFSSNDYLSLATSPLLRKRLLSALDVSPVGPLGPSSSRLLDGNTPTHLAVERQLSSFLSADAGLLFNSGFDANSGLWASLPAPDDFILYDALIHASTHDGMRLSRVPEKHRLPFRHNDYEDLEKVLRELRELDGVRSGVRTVWVAVETLYSMDGDLCPLTEMVEVVERVLDRGNGHVVVDEAHSTGLYGPKGRGIVCALGLASRITIRVHTFGKALACSGAIVLCNPLIRSYLINYARPLIYSTALPHMNVLAISTVFSFLEDGHTDAPAAHLHSLSLHLSTLLSLPLPSLSPSLPSSLSSLSLTTPILPLLTPNPRALAAFLVTKGFLVRPITYPTVPRGEERVRVCLHAGNTREEVEGLVRGVREWWGGEEGRGRGGHGRVAKL